MPLGTPIFPYVLQRLRTAQLPDFPYIAPTQVQTCAIDFGNFLPSGVTLTGAPVVNVSLSRGNDQNPQNTLLFGPTIGTVPTANGGSGIANTSIVFQLGNCLASTVYLIEGYSTRSDGDIAEGWSHVFCLAPAPVIPTTMSAIPISLIDVSTGSVYSATTLLSVRTQINWRSGTAASKTTTIPNANTVNSGYEVYIVDATGTAGDFPITISCVSTGTIGNQTNAVIASPYGAIRLCSDAAYNDWTFMR